MIKSSYRVIREQCHFGRTDCMLNAQQLMLFSVPLKTVPLVYRFTVPLLRHRKSHREPQERPGKFMKRF